MPAIKLQGNISFQSSRPQEPGKTFKPQRVVNISRQLSKVFKYLEIMLISVSLGLGLFFLFYHEAFLYEAAAYLYGLLEICRSWFDIIGPCTSLSIVWLPTVVVIALLFMMVTLGRNMPKVMRALLIGVLFCLHTVYIAFRIFSTVNLGSFLDSSVSIALFFVEFMSYICLCSIYLQLAWPTDRVREAALYSQAVIRKEFLPSVDVFIVTYNEPVDMLCRTILGCQAMEYPNKRIYLLDDKSRPEMRKLSEELSCHYISRQHNIHAKAGNINNAFGKTDGELVAVFDSDCIPTKMFLTKTVGFFQRLETGMVIASQRFYNAESDFKNMNVETVLSADQSNFFNEVEAGRDTFNAILCFGTGFVVRRQAINYIGGVPTETLSEDWATSIKLQAAGYKTHFINEHLTAGSAAESIGEFIQQRLRWAKGTLQSLYSSSNPLTVPGLNPLQRFIHAYGILYYLMFPLQLIVMLFPLAYFFFDIVPVKTTTNQMLFFFLPFFLLMEGVFSWVSNNYSSFISSHVYEYFLCIPMSRVFMRLLQDPRQKHFRVTRKGISRKQITFEADIAWPIIAFLFLYIAALVYGFYNARWRASGDVFVLMVIWCIFRIIVLWTTLQVAINLPQERKTTRFKHKLDCLVYHDREVYNGKTLDVSDGGIRVDLDRLPRFWTTGGLVKLDIPEINISGIPAFIRRYDKGRQVSFNYGGISIQQKRQLVSFLYCEDGRWSKMGLSSMRAVIVMFKSIFRIYPIENSRRSSV